MSLSTVGLPQLTNDEINPTDGTIPTLDRKPCESLAGKVEVVRRNEEAVEQNQAGVRFEERARGAST